MPFNTLIDILDATKHSESPDERWNAFAGAFRKLGSPFLNMGEKDQVTGETLQIRSNMRSDWINHWMDRDYIQIDPHAPPQGIAPRALSKTVWRASDARWTIGENGRLRRSYHAEHSEAGYDACVGIPCPVGTSSHVRCVMIGAGRGEEDFIDSETFQAMLLAAPLVALNEFPSEGAHADTVLDRRSHLSPREHDVLCLLANGFLNARIAEKLGISEHTVRSHMISARTKLGCATREQALAVAIVRGLITP
ncbi:LuxR C-terminal-related transcriptional regulator [Amaricoccus macauensis]|uniref:helix-turn-helix transcriptional regulator n=1 Tax=Amaricoccus macauensis TaxID=57001 RepID=UPI003C7B0DA1